MFGTNRGILVKVHLMFYIKKVVCYANVFYLVNADRVRRKVFALMFLVWHQLKQDQLLNFF